MNKTLVVGDIHCKPHITRAVKKLLPNYDKVVFLGDYEDDWTATPELSYQTVKELIDLKLSEPDKIILLWGNHTASNAIPDLFKCSGFNSETHTLLKDLYDTKLNGKSVFQLAYSEGNYLFTHAGVTNSYLKLLKASIQHYYPDLQSLVDHTTAEKLCFLLNTIFYNGLKDHNYPLFRMLNQVGPARGGYHQIPSPLWADKSELLKDPIPGISQVVGHTPVKTITIDKKTSSIFCDTFSTSFIPFTGLELPIGDSTLLELSFNKIHRARKKIIKL